MDLDINLDFNKIFEQAFSALAKGMNIAEEVLLPIMVKQMFIEGILGLVVMLLFLLIALGFLVMSILTYRKTDEADTLWTWGFVIIFFIYSMAIFIPWVDGSPSLLVGSVTKTFNPEYAVIQEVVKMAKDLIK